ncbi:CopD family protein [Xanthobacter autotrophicus]|uniref:CopD family protein n=1 Tax=Xanthobacter autotrophicus TaxID=280 RepID=UPI001E3B822B|nr:CopD family protein [Xanthobacter autotrophicus]UDQ91929.1 CopD family protein [Xanthobacter autotrophicus]
MFPLILAARCTHFAAGLVLLGASLFVFTAVPAWAGAAGASAMRAAERMVLLALPVALASALVWAGAALVDITGTPASLTDPSLVSGFLMETGFGRAMAFRLAALCVAALAALTLRGRRRLAAIAAAEVVLMASESLLGHPGAAAGTRAVMLVAVHAVHGLGAAVWIGGLLPLIVLLDGWAKAPEEAGKAPGAVLRRFSRIGIGAVLMVGVGGGLAAILHIETLAALPGTIYGRIVVLKASVFAGLVCLALRNRHIALRLVRSPTRGADLARIAVNSRMEVALALAAVFLAALLGMSDPQL